ncbi:hypothetical protein QBC41DRAFT_256848 [Cercophora samala]|uniref:Uncharacterized protein n=1 Tax=Cercophora samala TaxID=330535 RepID=A0AA40D8X4_9PEZI|nr:hypothetical protein QBC41DRAFT_256848 [Cercophora samala]
MAAEHPDGGGSPRKPTDYNLILAFHEYVTNDETCHPKFANYFVDWIDAVWPKDEGDPPLEGTKEYDEWLSKWNSFFAYCDSVLRNPGLKHYNFPPWLLQRIEKYDIWNDWFPEEGAGPTQLEYQPIPEQYRVGPEPPSSSLRPKTRPAEVTPLAPKIANTYLTPESPGTRKVIKSPVPAQIPSSPVSVSVLESSPAIEDIQVDTDGPDFTQKSYDQYGAVREPLAIHLQEIWAYLEYGDSRDRGYSEQMSNTIDYLTWLGSGNDPRNQLRKASDFSKSMYKKVMEMVAIHGKRGKAQAILTPVVFTDRPISFSATRSSRLNHLTNVGDFPLPSKRGVPNYSHLLPYNITPSPQKRPTQGVLLKHPEHYEQFVEDEGKIWLPYSDDLKKLTDMEIPSEVSQKEHDNNLAVIESDIYVEYVKARGLSATWQTGDPIGWTIQKTDKSGERQTYITTGKNPKTGKEMLHLMDLSDPRDWASVRGVRRAGLQLMLRNYRTNENDFVYYDSNTNGQRSRRLVLPIPVSTIRRVMDKADGRQWVPPTIFDGKKPLKWIDWEPFAFTDRFIAYTEATRLLKEQAYTMATERHLRDRPWVSLPKNIVNGGPFVWRGLNPKEQAEEDLLKQCLGVRDYIAMCWNKAPRPLLATMIQFLTAVDPGSDTFPEPNALYTTDEITFGESEYSHTVIDGTRQRAGYRYINDEDIWWLKFLGSGSVNKKSWAGKIFPDEPKTTYRLFHIFARRVLRLLEDPNPEGILYSSASVATVEGLLKVINAGTNGKSAVNKYEFSPYEACQHLDRLAQTGHISFELDPACYGQVRRPVYDFYPEHRIAYDPKLKTKDTLFPRSVRPWVDICLEPYSGNTKNPPPVTYAVKNCYRALAYRLGFTIFHLQKKSIARMSRELTRNEQPVQYAWLHDSIKKFDAIHEDLLKLELKTRPNPPAPYGSTWRDIRALVQDVEQMDGGHVDPGSNLPQYKDNDSALQYLRGKIIYEVGSSNTLLAPARAKKVVDPVTGTAETILTRAVSWQFGSLDARQEGWRRQFFSVNRWPVVAQSEKTQGKIKKDEWFADGVDPKQVFDYQSADPIHAFFSREKLRPYVEEPVKYRQGPAIYPIGDTPHQRKQVQNHMTALVYQSLDMNGANLPGGTFTQKLFNFFSWPLRPYLNSQRGLSEAELEEKYGKLPAVAPDRVPRSWRTQNLVADKVANRKRMVDELLTRKEQEEQERKAARFKRRRVDDVVAGAMVTMHA